MHPAIPRGLDGPEAAEGASEEASRFGVRARSLITALCRPVDGASLGAFRILFGALLVVAPIRSLAHGWVERYFVAPRMFFPHGDLALLRPFPGHGMYVAEALMIALGAMVLLGFHHRAAIALYGVLFTHAHLVDRTNYLNHYHLVSLLCLLGAFLPLSATASVDAWRGRADRHVVACQLWLLQFQIGCVYFFGGVAKLRPDWLLEAQPLTIWLRASTELPILGALFHHKAMAFAMSWGGAAFDLAIPFLLLSRRTRVAGFVLLLSFHGLTARLFSIGIFPFLMTLSALLFFPPEWPRRVPLLARLFGAPPDPPAETARISHRGRMALVLAAAYVTLQIVVPLRHLARPGNTLWTEDGFRFAWNVMVMEKSGAIELTVTDPDTGVTSTVDNRALLTRYQERMVATQPDMILSLAHHVAAIHRERGARRPEVRVKAWVTLNGRPAELLVDPELDLAGIPLGAAASAFVRPAPVSRPVL